MIGRRIEDTDNNVMELSTHFVGWMSEHGPVQDFFK